MVINIKTVGILTKKLSDPHSAADIIEFVSETVGDDPTYICDGSLHLILWFCWALSLFQFAFSFAPYAKTREHSPS